MVLLKNEIDLASHLPALHTLHKSFYLKTEAQMTEGPGLPLHYCVKTFPYLKPWGGGGGEFCEGAFFVRSH